MLERGKMERGIYEIVDTESLVPAEHLLRKIDAAINWNKLYDIVEPLYCEDHGRPSIDPVVLFKMVLIQHLYGLPSLRRTAEEVSLNVAYRWFLGYRLQEETPHFSTISYNFKHRFTLETVNQIFDWILSEIAEAGYLYTYTVFVDGTHIKANANNKKVVKEEVEVEAKRYAEELMEEVNTDRIAHGKKPFATEEEETDENEDNDPPSKSKKKRDNTSKKKLKKRKKEAKKKIVTKSTTDPDAGMFVKGDHKKQMAYEAHTVCNQHGYVLEVEVTPGNVHDSVAFDDIYDKLVEKHPEVKTVVADSAYKTPHICKKVFEDGRELYAPYTRPKTMEGGHEWWKYVYDEYYDCIICPEFQVLKYSTTNRDGYREYKSNPQVCANCPTRALCTRNKDFIKTVTQHIWKPYVDMAEELRYTERHKRYYKMRKETIERVFADAKEKHGMRYTRYTGLAQVTNWVRLKFAAMNLKKFAIRKWEDTHILLQILIFPLFLSKIDSKPQFCLTQNRGFSTVWEVAHTFYAQPPRHKHLTNSETKKGADFAKYSAKSAPESLGR